MSASGTLGLESHPGHEIAARQMHGGFGGIVSVQLAAGAEAAKHFVDHTQIFTLAESLGGVESLIQVPAAMTHASVAGTTLQVPANLVRISVWYTRTPTTLSPISSRRWIVSATALHGTGGTVLTVPPRLSADSLSIGTYKKSPAHKGRGFSVID